MKKIIVNAIVACDPMGTIGKGSGLPWSHLKEDMAHFKNLTMGSTLLMGKGTFESLPLKIYRGGFEGRHMLVSSNEYNLNYYKINFSEHLSKLGGVNFIPYLTHNNIDFLLPQVTSPEIYVIGGRGMFLNFLDGMFDSEYCQTGKLHITAINQFFPGDVRIPELIDLVNLDTNRVMSGGMDSSSWRLVNSKCSSNTEQDAVRLRFLELERVR